MTDGREFTQIAVGGSLVLGGVVVPSEKGCDGHSDADVLLHAIADALLGAAGMAQEATSERAPCTSTRHTRQAPVGFAAFR